MNVELETIGRHRPGGGRQAGLLPRRQCPSAGEGGGPNVQMIVFDSNCNQETPGLSSGKTLLLQLLQSGLHTSDRMTMTQADKAQAQKARATGMLDELKRNADAALLRLYRGRVGAQMLRAVQLAEIAYGSQFALTVKQQAGKLLLSKTV